MVTSFCTRLTKIEANEDQKPISYLILDVEGLGGGAMAIAKFAIDF
jgi:hypothetical protein